MVHRGSARLRRLIAVHSSGFKDPTADRVGPIAWQMHNAGLLDEYKDVTIEIDPKDHDLITVK